ADLFFFLKMDEIQRLLKGERNPLLVMKAKQRKRLYPTMNALKFDEFVKGFRMAPRVSRLNALVYKKLLMRNCLLTATEEGDDPAGGGLGVHEGHAGDGGLH